MLIFLRFKASQRIAKKVWHDHSRHMLKIKFLDDKTEIEIPCKDARSECIDEELYITPKGHKFGCTCPEIECIRRPKSRW